MVTEPVSRAGAFGIGAVAPTSGAAAGASATGATAAGASALAGSARGAAALASWTATSRAGTVGLGAGTPPTSPSAVVAISDSSNGTQRLRLVEVDVPDMTILHAPGGPAFGNE